MADWKKLLVENPPASDIASSPSSGKVLKVSANGTGLEWADDAGGAFQITGSNAHYTAGSVGIGTNSPSAGAKLHVVGSNSTSILKVQGNGSVAGIQISKDGSDINAIATTSTNLLFQTGASTRMLLNNTGLGIGTTSPSEGLHLSNKNLLFERAGYDTSDQIKWKVGGNDRFTLRFDTTAGGLLFYNEQGGVGNHLFLDRLQAHVGIGTTSPSTTLDVNGNIKAGGTSRLYFNTNATGVGSSTVNQLDVFSFGDMNISTENSSTSIKFKTTGTERVRINSTGVGIGTTSPQAKFVIAGNTNTWDGMAKMYLYDSNSNSNSRNWAVGNGGTGYGQLSFVVSNTKDGQPDDAGTAVAVMDGVNKRVGIGTLLPSYKLDIQNVGTTEARIKAITNTGRARLRLDGRNDLAEIYFGVTGALRSAIYQSTSSPYTLNVYSFANSSNVATFDTSNMRVGIGTETPSNTLSIKGSNSNMFHFDPANATLFTNTTSMYLSSNSGSSALILTHSGSTPILQANSGGNIGVLSNLGIGTSAPSDYGTSATNLVIYEAGNAGLSIITGTSNTGNIHFGDGTSASSSERRGMIRYDHSSDDFIFWTAGSEKLRITDDGKIGIGTSSPSANLHVNGTARIDNFLSFSGNHYLQDVSNNYLKLRVANGDYFAIHGGASDLEYFRLTNDGKVGIGTNSPSSGAKLHVVGSNSNSILKIQGGGANAGIEITRNGTDVNAISTTGANLIFATGGSTRMLLNNTGLGIGTTSPSQKLDIYGSMVIDGWIRGWEIPSNHTYGRYWMNFNSGNPLYRTGADNKYHRFQRYSDEDVMVVGGTNKCVGIGTSSPTNKLQINHNSSTTLGLYVAHSANEYSGLAKFYTNSSNNTARSLVEIHNDNSSSTAIIPLKITQDADGTALAITNGKVGIGTTSPSAKLDVSGGALHVNSAGSTSSAFQATGQNGQVSFSLIPSAGNPTSSIVAVNTILSLRPNGTNVLNITNAGRVGINTTAPTEALTVEGAIQQTKIKIYNSGNQGFIDHSGAFGGSTFFIRQLGSNHDIRFQTNKGGSTTTALAIDGLTHNIGIGTESPGSILELSSSNPAITLTDTNGGNGRISANGGHLSFQADYGNAVGGSRIDFESDGSLRMRIDANSRISLSNNDSGTNNTIFGKLAGNAVASGGTTNNFIGFNTAYYTTTGDNNVVTGAYALFYNETGSNNTAFGTQAMQGASGQSNSNNTALGYQALMSIETGSEIVALGFRSGNNISTGDSHVIIGNASGGTLTNGRRCTVIGDESDVSASGALNQTVIGQGATGVQDNSAIIGNSACADVFMGDNGSAWSTTSDGRLKENIKEWSTGLNAINKLRVVEYNFKEDNPYKYDHKKKRQGIIAQEAIEAIPEMIKDDGEWLTANQEPMIWALVNAVQELTKKVNELETKLNKEN